MEKKDRKRISDDMDEASMNRMKKSAKFGAKKGGGAGRVLDFSSIGEEIPFYKGFVVAEYKNVPHNEKGKNEIDIIPFRISEEWYSELRSVEGSPTGIKKGGWDYKLEIPVHGYVGVEQVSFLCLQYAFGEACPICEDRLKRVKAGDPAEGDDGTDKLKPKWRTYYNIIDLNNVKEKIQVFDVSYHMFEKLVCEEAWVDDEGNTPFAHITDGKTISFGTRKKVWNGREFIEAKNVEFEDREEGYEKSMIDEAYPLDKALVIPEYDDVAKAHFGGEGAEDNQSETADEDDIEEDNEDDEREAIHRTARKDVHKARKDINKHFRNRDDDTVEEEERLPTSRTMSDVDDDEREEEETREVKRGGFSKHKRGR